MSTTENHDANATGSLRDRVQRLRLPPQMEAGSPRYGVWLPWSLCLLTTMSTTGLLLKPTFHRSEPESKGAAPALSTVENEAIASSGAVVLESKGYIIPAHQIQVSPKVSGIVMELNIEEGRKVKEGQVLAVLEKINYAASVKRAEATLAGAVQRHLELKCGPLPEEKESARASWEEAKAQRDQLYLDWKRNLDLKTRNALAPRDFEVAESAFKAMERRARKLEQDYRLLMRGYRVEKIAAAAADVALAEADLITARWNLDSCEVKAPVSGTILTKKAEKGNIVNPIAFNISVSLCEMADLSDLEVDLSIQERDISVVKPQQRCRVRSEAFPDRLYDGVVSRLMPIADQAKGAIPVRVKLLNVSKDEEGVFLKPQMSVIVSFLKK